MLNNLIESRSKTAENGRKSRFMGVTFVAVAATLVTLGTTILFRVDIGMNGGEFDMASLVAPVSIAQEQPPVPEQKVIRRSSAPAAPKKVTLPEFYDEVGKTAPSDTAGKPNVIDASKFDPGLLEKGPLNIPEGAGSPSDSTSAGLGTGGDSDADEVPPVRKEEPVIPKQVTGGVMNGKAVYLEKPAFSAAAIAVRATGTVDVEVIVDENGRVVSAKAKNGHPLLRGSAEKAAMASRFTPTLLSNQPVKVSGIIIYRFNV